MWQKLAVMLTTADNNDKQIVGHFCLHIYISLSVCEVQEKESWHWLILIKTYCDVLARNQSVLRSVCCLSTSKTI